MDKNNFDESVNSVLDTVKKNIDNILGTDIRFDFFGSLEDTDLNTGKTEKINIFSLDAEHLYSNTFLNNLLIITVEGQKEVAFMTSSSKEFILEAMSDKEKEAVKNDSIVTAEIDKVRPDEWKKIIDFVKNDYDNLIASESAKWPKIVPQEFDLGNDVKLVILNFFIRNVFIGFIDVFVNIDDYTYSCYAARMVNAGKNPKMEKMEFDSFLDAVNFVTKSE